MIRSAAVFFGAMLAATAASADSVSFEFKGTETITVRLNNLTCELKGSDVDPVPPKGCNYTIDVDPVAGTYSVTLADDDPEICTPTGAEVCTFDE
ncbi:hypothetical protein [Bauldia sp.]|uniref:hypothetical protein n=1 Tax=Bauldia sp. TaxID=2575872 RepID=UPI003BABE7DA